MGTPRTGSCSPLIDNPPTCLLCHHHMSKASLCSEHNLCEDCEDNFCPFCLKQLSPMTVAEHQVFPTHGDVLWHTKDMDIKIVFVYSFIADIVVQRSEVNCRLQCTWASTVFDVHVYRGRTPYSGLSIVLPKLRGECLYLLQLPPSLHAPKLKGTLCSWRLFLEMYTTVLDRPEVRKLHLLPNTVEDFLTRYALNPQKNKQVWQYASTFAKYGCFFFTTDAQTKQVGCLQCGTEHASLETLYQECLGGTYMDSIPNLYSAIPVNIHFHDGVIQKTIAPTPFSTYKMFMSMMPHRPQQKQRTFQPSCYYRISLDPSVQSVVPESAIKYVHLLLSRNSCKVQKFFVFDLKSQAGFLTEIKLWLCIGIRPCADIVHVSDLTIFESCLHLALYNQIQRYGRVSKTAWGTTHYWHDLHAGRW